jgi:hypothetical protein
MDYVIRKCNARQGTTDPKLNKALACLQICQEAQTADKRNSVYMRREDKEEIFGQFLGGKFLSVDEKPAASSFVSALKKTFVRSKFF